MKHIKEFEDQEIQDVIGSLSGVGFDTWKGFFVAYLAASSEDSGQTGLYIIAENFSQLLKRILEHFNLEYEDFEDDVQKSFSEIKTHEEIWNSIYDFLSDDMSPMGIKNMEWKITELTPRKYENTAYFEDLLNVQAINRTGKMLFSDWDSKMS
jgi:hypothetical protein